MESAKINRMLITAHRSAATASGQQQRIVGADLGDAWVGAFDILAGQVQPVAGVRVDGGAVVPQGAPPFSAAPATLELPLCLQTHAAAVSLGRALVQVH